MERSASEEVRPVAGSEPSSRRAGDLDVILVSSGSDREVQVEQLLREQGFLVRSGSIGTLEGMIRRDTGMVLVLEDTLRECGLPGLSRLLQGFSTILDPPFLVLSSPGARDRGLDDLLPLENVIVLEWSMASAAWIGTLHALLHSRLRQKWAQTLSDLAGELAQENHSDRVLDVLWKSVGELLKIEYCILHEARGDSPLRFVGQRGLSAGEASSIVAAVSHEDLSDIPDEVDEAMADPLTSVQRVSGPMGFDQDHPAHASFLLRLPDHDLALVRFGARNRLPFTSSETRFLGSLARMLMHNLSRLWLEEALRERSRHLEAEAKQKDEFLSVLGHELRSPLATVGLALRLLEGSHLQDVAMAPILAAGNRQLQQMLGLVNQLLDVARIARGRIELNRRGLDLAGAVEEMAQELGPRFVAQEKFLEVEGSRTPLPIHADPIRIRQILENVLTNALKYTGGGDRVDVRSSREGAWAVVTVQDTGIGMPMEYLSRIFDMFRQGAGVLTRAQGGIGIGLSLVQKLVRLHGGEVKATSPGPGLGSCFTIRLPLRSETTPARSTTVPVGDMRKMKVLIVEDQPDVADTLRVMVESFGHDVILASDGVEGVEMVSAHAPELVLMDLGLPRLDGFSAARRIRDATTAAPRLVAVSGFCRPSDREAALRSGFDDHFAKPLDLETLERILLASVPSLGDGMIAHPPRAWAGPHLSDRSLSGPR